MLYIEPDISSILPTLNSTRTNNEGKSPTQRSASQHATVGAVQFSTTHSGLQAVSTLPQIHLDGPSENIYPSAQTAMREVSDVLSDYQEVQTVVHGGHGSRESGDASWGTDHCRVHDTPAADKNADTLSSLPFAASDIPTEVLAPAKPVIKTNSLPTFTLKYNGGCFIDRVLPTPAAPIIGHDR